MIQGLVYILFMVAQSADSEVGLVAPDEYAVRRFAEVIEAYQDAQPSSPKEKLLRYRALLVIAEKREQELRNPSPERSAAGLPLGIRRENLIKGLEAEVDHFRKQIRQLEAQIKKSSKSPR